MHMLAFLLTLNSAAIANVNQSKLILGYWKQFILSKTYKQLSPIDFSMACKLSNETKVNYNCVKILIHEGDIEVSSYVINQFMASHRWMFQIFSTAVCMCVWCVCICVCVRVCTRVHLHACMCIKINQLVQLHSYRVCHSCSIKFLSYVQLCVFCALYQQLNNAALYINNS